VTAQVEVRRARLSDTEAIAQFVNAARSGDASGPEVTRLSVADRFGQIGFMVAESDGELAGVLGWQVENLVVRVTDYLIAASQADPKVVGAALVEKMEAEARDLQVETSLLFLPPEPSLGLVSYWEGLGYTFSSLDDLHRACREAVADGGLDVQDVMVKQLREDRVRRPM